MSGEKLQNIDVLAKANVYFDGRVTSHTCYRTDGSRFTLGIITAGSYTFNVGDREVVRLISGEVEVKRPCDTDWASFQAPQTFEIQADCDYDIRTYNVAEYICDYYRD